MDNELINYKVMIETIERNGEVISLATYHRVEKYLILAMASEIKELKKQVLELQNEVKNGIQKD
jgi:hypothetical protein